MNNNINFHNNNTMNNNMMNSKMVNNNMMKGKMMNNQIMMNNNMMNDKIRKINPRNNDFEIENANKNKSEQRDEITLYFIFENGKQIYIDIKKNLNFSEIII